MPMKLTETFKKSNLSRINVIFSYFFQPANHLHTTTDGLPARLVNPTLTGQCFGRVEVQYAGQWGSLCGNDWSISKAEVVCGILGCGNPASISGIAQFGQGTGPIWEASDLCFDNEASLFSCSIKGFNSTRCSHTQDAAVVCAGTV